MAQPMPPNQAQGGIRGLLERIRAQLRRYLLLECLALALALLVGWVAISAMFDHGLFRFLGLDLALDAPPFVRTWQKWVVLALAAWLIVPRLALAFRPKPDADLALVLEKQRPGVFGETLITTLELADPAKVRSSGYSEDLVRAAGRQADEAAARLDPSTLLTWGRLRGKLVWAGVALAALYPALVAWTSVERKYGRPTQSTALSLAGETFDTLGFWWERTVAGADVAWPRSAFARITGFPAEGTRRVGKAAPHTVQIRSYRFVTAEPFSVRDLHHIEEWLVSAGLPGKAERVALLRLGGTRENGWRPITWPDALRLTGDPAAPGAIDLPARAPWVDPLGDAPLLLDDLLALADSALASDARQGDTEIARRIKKVAETLEEKSAAHALSRRVRVLAAPEKVTLEIAENQGSVEGLVGAAKPVSHTLQADGKNARSFSHRIQAVAGDLDLRVVAADHHGPKRVLLAISPTSLSTLMVQEARPGYLKTMIDPVLEGAARDKALADLAAQTELVDLGDRLGSRSEETELVFPAGTALRMRGQLPGDRRWGGARLDYGAGGNTPAGSTRLATNGERELTLETGKTLVQSGFRVILEDSDGIVGERKLKLTPMPDEPPTLEMRPSDDLRETDRGYVSTAGGRIPWVGAAGDKQGLGRVYQVHSYRVAREEGVAVSVAGALGMATGSGYARLFPLGQVGALMYASPGQRAPRRLAALLASSLQGGPSVLAVPGFLSAALEGTPVEKTRLLPGFVRQVRASPAGQMINQFAVEADGGVPAPGTGNDFPLALALEGRPAGEALEYGRTIVDLRVEAEDLDVVTTADGTGPGQPHRSATPAVAVRIISDDDMLDLLQGDSLRLRAQVQEMRDLLMPADPSLKTPVRHLFELQGLESELRETENRVDPTRRDGDSITRLLEETRGRGREIEQAYLRLLRQTGLAGFEVKREQSQVASLLGQLNREMIGALDGAIEQFNRARNANAPASERVARMRDTSARARDLVRFLDQILDAMGGASDLNREVTRLRGILREQESQARRLETLRKELVNRLLDDLLKP